ncbi:hypothetical protein QQF64_032014 [Cirrhinus molitorella]|uniref:Secreted protein n=1 Tax=Cirrhinus molitorella TaxID=172907 RepID=A0ABR3MYS5_9TELE
MRFVLIPSTHASAQAGRVQARTQRRTHAQSLRISHKKRNARGMQSHPLVLSQYAPETRGRTTILKEFDAAHLTASNMTWRPHNLSMNSQ